MFKKQLEISTWKMSLLQKIWLLIRNYNHPSRFASHIFQIAKTDEKYHIHLSHHMLTATITNYHDNWKSTNIVIFFLSYSRDTDILSLYKSVYYYNKWAFFTDKKSWILHTSGSRQDSFINIRNRIEVKGHSSLDRT